MRITRLFIDNYKCFVGFDFKPQAIQPIFGLNGTGKSTLFQILEALRHFILGRGNTETIFPSRSLTRWGTNQIQLFTLEVGSESTRYLYELRVRHSRDAGRGFVDAESLRCDSELVFRRIPGETAFFRDDGSEAPGVLLDARYSGLGFQNPSIDSERLTTFRRWAESLVNVSLSPHAISARSDHEESELDWGARNFASWLRHVYQTRLSSLPSLFADLSDVILGFKNLPLVPEGDARFLRVEMGGEGQPSNIYDFTELSDGQRVLIVLYTVLHAHLGTNAILCFDEPANYLALAEIQPYLLRLRDAVGNGLAQLFVVTHNPEAINDLAPDHPALFTRADDGSIQILPFPEANPNGLSAAELVARGWEQP